MTPNRLPIVASLLSISSFAFGSAVPASAPVPLQGSAALESPTVSVSGTTDIRVYPNPWRSDRDQDRPVTFDRFPPNSTLKIFTVAGQHVKTLDLASGSGAWDRTNEGGDKVASGIYLYLASDILGQEYRGKLAIIK